MKKEKRVTKGVKKIDRFVTGIIIGGAVASIFGMSKTKKGRKITKRISKKTTGFFRKIYNFIGKIVIYAVKLFGKK